jgi:GAF domain-containing protein
MTSFTADRTPGRDAVAAAIALSRSRAREEMRRADRAEAIAVSYEARGGTGPERLRLLRVRLAELHRQMEVRHRTTAILHELHVARMEGWLADGRHGAAPPGFMSAVAEAIGVRSATAAMRGQDPASVVATSSDELARAAHDLESALGEGPALAAIAEGTPVSAGSGALAARWPLYGPAVAELGVRSVLAVPLQNAAVRLGSLCVYGQEPDVGDGVTAVAGRIAEAVTDAVLQTEAGDAALGEGSPPGSLFGEADFEPALHQAVGMVAAQCGCGVADAEALLRARAFAESRPVLTVARAVLRGDIHLG